MNESIVAAIVLVLVLVLPILFGVRYLLSHYANNEQQDELFKDAKEMLYVYQNKKKTTGVIGILGGIVILIGEFMPYASLWSFSITFYEGIKSESSLHALLAIIAPVILIVMYLSKRQYAGMGLGLLCLVFYAYLTIRDIDSFGNNILSEVADIGYWIIWIGLALAVVSPFCEKANRKLLSIIKREEQKNQFHHRWCCQQIVSQIAMQRIWTAAAYTMPMPFSCHFLRPVPLCFFMRRA